MEDQTERNNGEDSSAQEASPPGPAAADSSHPPAPASPTADRRPVRRRRKLASKDCSADPNAPSGSAPSPDDHDPPTLILLPPEIRLPITIQYLFVPSRQSSDSKYSHKLQNHPSVSKTSPLFSYYDGETTRLSCHNILSNPHHSSPAAPSARISDLEPGQQSSSSSSSDNIFNVVQSVPHLKTHESPVKGELIEWFITEGQILHERDGWRTRPILKIKEPCTHAVQWHGQCAICGSDLTIGDYTGISETSRASIPMSHGPSTLTVSVSEAQRLESETRSRLLKAQKLSLIVDLDQTIVHATVDPTVGEWMSDPSNPNWPALQGVSRFQLNDGPNVTNEGCYYYLKQRPGLSEFLHSLADKYEMHVYTMGTRAYADAVCKIIDPAGDIFGNRILSRDESGSMTQKSITRLFPVDTSMVVIIDDRGDVWEYSPNLVAVVPYNFFVGIGDINGAFLPPARPLEPSPAENEGTPPSLNTQEEVRIPTMTVTDDSGSTSSFPQGEAQAPSGEPSSGPPSDTTIVTAQACETSSLPTISGTTVMGVTDGAAPLTTTTTTTTTAAAAAATAMSEEEMVKTARSKLIADQVLSRPLKQKQKQMAMQQEAQRVHQRTGGSHKRSTGSAGTGVSRNGGSSNASKSASSSRATTPRVGPPGPPATDLPCPDPLVPTRLPDTAAPPAPVLDQDLASTAAGPAGQPPLASSIGSQTESGHSAKSAPNDDSSDSDTNTDLSMDEFNDQFVEQAVLVDQDKELSRLEFILGDIHSGFYSQDSIEEADARVVISAIKHDVLHGIHVAFSSLWPMEAVSEQQYAWKLAEQFGASCYTQLTPRVTHLIAAKLGTSKVNTALSRPNVAVVRPKWLYDAALLWTRPAEEGYSWRAGLGEEGSSVEKGNEEEGDGFEDGPDSWGVVGMGAADWKEATAEVMAALDESDDDSALEERRGSSSDEDEHNTRGRKRGRSSGLSTPARSPSRDRDPLSSAADTLDADSPLSKRKRMARSRSSKLKLVVPLNEEDDDNVNNDDGNPSADASSQESAHAQPLLPPSILDQLSPEDDEFLSALAAEMEGSMAS
ncbi:hypothetical protein PCASD_23097 [Puccinia coronata f. sp. avenae]|uniref:protein-serine/threonine phosphatase n=1 Tax=Puccinia coronata f. sp. avenae TaxID=200324 RepID=A0A2N5SCM5_9BASI|nr:hypothetical protein PCASD_23097 [Puccinia coronata f. sp. avenae]